MNFGNTDQGETTRESLDNLLYFEQQSNQNRTAAILAFYPQIMEVFTASHPNATEEQAIAFGLDVLKTYMTGEG